MPRTGYELSPYDNELARLFWGRFPIERAASLIYYQPHSEASRFIYSLKYGRRPDIGRMMGRWIAQEFREEGFFEDVDVIIPVPLTKRRKHQRGYNQSTEIARGLSEETGIIVAENALQRVRFDESQTQKKAVERLENVENAFSLSDAVAVRGKHILLVDDVVTTGATLTACAKELMKAGDCRFSILVLGYSKPQ